jgi:lysophospholipase L1-like esterase
MVVNKYCNSFAGAALRKFCALLLCAALLAGCSKIPQVPPLGNDGVVLAFGDSLTYGTGASPAESYPAQLQTLIGRKVINAGVPGEMSSEGLLRLSIVLAEVRPKLLILCHGGNDFLRKLGETEVNANMRAMIKLAKTEGIGVVLVATPKPGLSISPPDFYAQLAKEYSLPFDDDVLKSILRDNDLKSDLIHPNAKGYAQFAAALAKLLKKAGAV